MCAKLIFFFSYLMLFPTSSFFTAFRRAVYWGNDDGKWKTDSHYLPAVGREGAIEFFFLIKKTEAQDLFYPRYFLYWFSVILTVHANIRSISMHNFFKILLCSLIAEVCMLHVKKKLRLKIFC